MADQRDQHLAAEAVDHEPALPVNTKPLRSSSLALVSVLPSSIHVERPKTAQRDGCGLEQDQPAMA